MYLYLPEGKHNPPAGKEKQKLKFSHLQVPRVQSRQGKQAQQNLIVTNCCLTGNSESRCIGKPSNTVDQKQPNYAKRTQFQKDQNKHNFC